MRIFLSLVLLIFCSFKAQAEDPGRLQIYYFKGSELPKKSKVYFKDTKTKKVTNADIFTGFADLEKIEGTYFVSSSKKGPFYAVKVVSGETSQISFDLKKDKPFIAKYDSFTSDIKIDKLNLKTFKGKILSNESGAPVKEASVFLSGSNLSTKTDKNGRYEIKVPEGQDYTLSVVHPDYRAKILEVESGQGAQATLKMHPSMGELSEYVVVAPKTKGSIEALLKERRNASTVSVSIGSEQFKKSGDSNAASALKRVSGLSLVEGKFVYVRGLGERYSSTTLNGSTLPSPNPSRRVVPLDMFPTSLIESVLIQKSYSVDKPAQFSAGLVEIRTLSIPKGKGFLNLSLSTGASSDDILAGKEKSLAYQGGGSSDRLGIDDGARELPKAIRDLRRNKTELKIVNQDDCDFFGECDGLSLEDVVALGASFSNVYNTKEEEAALNRGLSFEGGNSLKMGSSKAGFILKGLYSNNNDVDTDSRNAYVIGSDNDLVLDRKTETFESSSRYNIGGVLSLGAEVAKRHKFEVTNIVTRSTENKTEIVERDALANTEDSFRITRLSWEERELNSMQFKGEHSLFENYKGPKLDWLYAESESSRYRPDNREYFYSLATGAFIDRNFGNERSFSDLKDQAKDLSVKISTEIKPLSWLSFKVQAGSRSLKKERESSNQRFTFIRQGTGLTDLTGDLESIISRENIENGEFQLRDSTLATDNYRAAEDNNALFTSLTTGFSFKNKSKLELISGVRYERHNQNVRAFNIVDGVNSPDVSNIDQNEHFYNFGLVYSPNSKLKVRAGYSDTVARPDLQEFAPVVYFNDEENILEQGNPDLKIADVQNLDLRFDYNFNNREFLSFGVFRKKIKNPIETVTVISSEDIRTFENIDGALNDGIEIEFRKYLYGGFSLNGNYSRISSEVDIDRENAGASTSLDRPLQGQSPYLVNIGIDYEFKKEKFNTALVYNVAGRRISEVGAFGSPDIYEESFRQLDFTLSKRLSKKLSLSFRARNLLDPLAERTQGGFQVRAIRYGRSYSLNLTTSI